MKSTPIKHPYHVHGLNNVRSKCQTHSRGHREYFATQYLVPAHINSVFSALSFSLLADIHWQIAIMHSSRALTDEIMSLCRSARVVCCRRRMRTASGQTLTTFPENLEMSRNLTDVRGIKILSGQLLLASCLGPRQCAVYFCLVGCFGFISPFWKYFLFVKSILNILQ